MLLLSVPMERDTAKISTNPGKPSSETAKDETAVSHVGTHIKGKIYDPSRLADTCTAGNFHVVKANSCEECGSEITVIPPKGEIASTLDMKISICHSITY